VKSILRPAGLGILAGFAGSNVLLAFDFDGTLAPIVSDPDRARMRPRTSRLLRRLAALYPCVVISGRSRADVLARLRGTRVRRVIGNHGAEDGSAGRGRREAGRWASRLRARLSAMPGVLVEEKGLSVSVHYRGDRPTAEAIREAARSLDRVRVFGGRRVVNVVAATAPNKGTALASARKQLGCEAAIYVGDDETDEDVFALGHPGTLLTIRVGRLRGSAAAYRLANQTQVDRLMELLVSMRSQ
jgi:trehalose 6-phosphate phosphatase